MEETQEQLNSKSNDRPWLFKKGQSGNPGGRPKGSISLKEYARRMILEMNDEEKLEFMNGLPKDKLWEMAEGKASQGIGQAEDLPPLTMINYADIKTPIQTQGLPDTTA